MLGHQSLGAGCARRLARLSRPPRASNSTASWRWHHLCWQRRALASARRTPKPQSQFNLNPQSKYKHSSRPILNRIPPQTPASSFFCNDSAHSDRFVSSSSSSHRHTVKMATEVRELNFPSLELLLSLLRPPLSAFSSRTPSFSQPLSPPSSSPRSARLRTRARAPSNAMAGKISFSALLHCSFCFKLSFVRNANVSSIA